VQAVSDSKGGIFLEDGLDIEAVIRHKTETGSVQDFPAAQNISNEAVLALDVKVLVPAALEGVITHANADDVKAKIILELANGPVTIEAGEELFKKGVMVVPDILANAGGVVVSYFEWVQNLRNYYWPKQKVEQRLKQKIDDATDLVWMQVQDYDINMRTAAYIIAMERITRALKLRGI
jgi:glutamate dehydrogenase/leucine dehydrogenase